ncbi:branched-chain amino acid ABC transporter permease [Neobacillus sp. PS3-12]|jgi:branched-chain amino acid transport system permease protein|uniref:branched-chain amino acid ABC transporter permease n=1 Tax=Neobacillus sp. PS3-12 TaxID=3070677 RepID=UPI0027E18E19|nr:branched-chain amino acid ABC transporter permease [Neobacillus sp. PS3-12]WML52357.1 branched-chain amino acid ABC transporter permease [Neobacillus sp. PS3-12]
MMKTKLISYLCGLIVLFFVPVLFPNDYFIHILVVGGINILLVLSLNIIAGFTGQISLGHAAFYGIGAYASAILSMKGTPVYLSILCGALIAGLIGFLIGYPFLRLRGHFFGIGTLGFGVIVYLVLNNWTELTNGPMGLSGIPAPEAIGAIDFTSKAHYYYLGLILILLIVYISNRMKSTKMGRALLAIRTDEITASAMGINVAYYKVLAFIWSAAIAGLAGALYGCFIQFLSPETFNLSMSINILLMLLIGGIGSVLGSVLGGLFITLLTEYLRPFAEYQMLIYSILIIIIVTFAPKGLNGLIVKTKGIFTSKLKGVAVEVEGGNANEPVHPTN